MKTFLGITFLIGLSLAEPPSYRQFQQNKQAYYVAPENQEVNSAPYEPSGWKPKGPAFNFPEKQTVENSYGPPKPDYGAPVAPQNQYGAPVPPQIQYGAPVAPQKQQFGAPAAPQKQYGAPAAPQKQYGAPAAPQKQYGAPAAPQKQQFGAPSAPQKQYGAPAVPQKQYIPQKQYSSPPQNYGPPNVPQEQYGVPEYVTTEQPGFNDDDDDEEPTTVRGLEESENESANAANELEEEVDPQQPQQSGEYYVALPDGRLQRVNYVSRQDAMKYFAKIRAENVEPLRGPIYAYAPLQKIELAPPTGLEVAVSPALVAPQETKSDFNAKLSVQPIAQVQYQLENTGSYSNYNANYQANDPRFIVAL